MDTDIELVREYCIDSEYRFQLTALGGAGGITGLEASNLIEGACACGSRWQYVCLLWETEGGFDYRSE